MATELLPVELLHASFSDRPPSPSTPPSTTSVSRWPVRWMPRRRPRNSAQDAPPNASDVQSSVDDSMEPMDALEDLSMTMVELTAVEDEEDSADSLREEDGSPDDFARLQAIIAGIPHQTVPERGTLAARAATRLMLRRGFRGDGRDRAGSGTRSASAERVTPYTASSSSTSPAAADAQNAERHSPDSRRDDGSLPPRSSAVGVECEMRLQERAEAALGRACLEYPEYAEQLRALTVVHASLDFLCLADHRAAKLFVAARGTDKDRRVATLPRDLGNDALIFFGFGPSRVHRVAKEYQAVCQRLQGYTAFGTGHSLGASVIEWLAVWAEAAPDRHKFARVDLFNPGSSPLRRILRGRRGAPAPVVHAEVRAHRVLGDLVSKFHKCAGLRYTHPRKPRLSAHALGHFLPQADEAATAARAAVADVATRMVARLTSAQAAARTAVSAIGARAVANVTRAQEKVALAEAAAAADAEGRVPLRQRFSMLRRQPRQTGGYSNGRWPRVGSSVGVGAGALTNGAHARAVGDNAAPLEAQPPASDSPKSPVASSRQSNAAPQPAGRFSLFRRRRGRGDTPSNQSPEAIDASNAALEDAVGDGAGALTRANHTVATGDRAVAAF